jgi:hypothetical protein
MMQTEEVRRQIATVDAQEEQLFLAAQKSPDQAVRAQASQIYDVFEQIKKQRAILFTASEKLGQYYALRHRALIGKIESLERMEALVGKKEFETEMARFARFVSDDQRLHRIARENIVNALAAVMAVTAELDSLVGIVKTADVVSMKEASNDIKIVMGLLENINKELVDRDAVIALQLSFVDTGTFGAVETVKKEIKAQKANLQREKKTLLDLGKRFQIAAQNQTAHLNKILPTWYQRWSNAIKQSNAASVAVATAGAAVAMGGGLTAANAFISTHSFEDAIIKSIITTSCLVGWCVIAYLSGLLGGRE